LGEFCDVRSGFAFKSDDWQDEGVPVVKIQNVRDGRVSLEGCAFVSEAVADSASGYELHYGDLLITMSGEIGAVGKVRSRNRLLLNQRVGCFKIHEPGLIDEGYFFAVLQVPSHKRWMEQVAYGAAQPNISPDLIKQLEILLPSPSQQRAIGRRFEIISDLIENNRRRIELLEEAARLLYQEWFVNFRYPGHEDVPLVDSELGPIPQGWEVGLFGDHIELLYGKALKADSRKGGDVAVFGSSGVVGWHDESLVPGPGIVVGRKGNAGSVHWSEGDFYPIDTTYFVGTSLPLRFVYYALEQQEFIDSHAAVPGLSRAQAYLLRFLLPTEHLLAEFVALVEPLLSLGQTLAKSTDVLTRARDLLLPRLVSGDLDVSDLDLGLEAVS
jgi:type I restriction enzyme S subunit